MASRGKNRTPAESRAAFESRGAELGGVVEGVYVNSRTPVAVRCSEGHLCSPRPDSVALGQGICRTCSGGRGSGAPVARNTPERFRSRVEGWGGSVIGTYVNNKTSVEVRCPKGHLTYPLPCNVLSGKGICRVCAGQVWDVLYVVTKPGYSVIKFGITSGNPRSRLDVHRRRYGLAEVLRLHEDLPGTAARDLETRIKCTLRDKGFKPLWGTEYFGVEALADVLALVHRELPKGS